MTDVKKFSDCVNDFKFHLSPLGLSFMSKLKKKIEMHVPRDRFNLIEPRMLSDGMQLSRALVSIALKVGSIEFNQSSGQAVPLWVRVASQADILNIHSVQERMNETGVVASEEVVNEHWVTMFGRDNMIDSMADETTKDLIKNAATRGLWRPESMPAYDMNNTNVNNCFFYSDAPGTPSFELTRMLMSEANRAGYQEIMVQHSQSNTTLHSVMQRMFETKQLNWRERCHAITM